MVLNLMGHPVSCVLGEYRFEKVPIPEPGPKEILVKVLAVGICAGDGKVLDGAERFWGKPGEEFVNLQFLRENSKSNHCRQRMLYAFARYARPRIQWKSHQIRPRCGKTP